MPGTRSDTVVEARLVRLANQYTDIRGNDK